MRERHGTLGLAFLAVAAWAAAGAGWSAAGAEPADAGRGGVMVSLGIFLVTLVAIVAPWIHETAAALAGAVLLWLVSYVGGTFWPALRITTFDESMAHVDWNVIFLVLGMMIFMAMFSETGVLRWLAVRAFRLARGNAWLLGLVLVLAHGRHLVSAEQRDGHAAAGATVDPDRRDSWACGPWPT